MTHLHLDVPLGVPMNDCVDNKSDKDYLSNEWGGKKHSLTLVGRLNIGAQQGPQKDGPSYADTSIEWDSLPVQHSAVDQQA